APADTCRWRAARSPSPGRAPASAARRNSALDAKHLLQRVHHLDEIRLVRHHLVDVLVRARNLVEHALVLAADHALRLHLEIGDGELLLRRVAAHPAARAMRARLEAFGVASAAHDVAARTHAPRDDAELAAAGADRALARDPDLLAVMALALDVIVVAVHRLLRRLERRQMPMHGVDHEPHHLGAVGARVVLCPADRLDIIIEVPRTFGEIGEVPIRQMQLRALRVAARELDEVRADGVADAAAARMQHHPHALRFVQAHLDEMVAAAERAELVHPARLLADAFLYAGMLLDDAPKALVEALRRMGARIAVLVAVDADRRRNDRLLRRNDRADGRADAEMHVGHGGDMVVHDRQLRDVDELLPGGSLELGRIDLDRHETFLDFRAHGHAPSILSTR